MVSNSDAAAFLVKRLVVELIAARQRALVMFHPLFYLPGPEVQRTTRHPGVSCASAQSRFTLPPVKFIIPMQPTLSRTSFSDTKWLFEPKYDGYRGLLFYRQHSIKLLSRNQVDLSKRFPELQSIELQAESALLDGEIVAVDQDGYPCFDALRSGKLRQQCEIVYYAFDLLHLNGDDLAKLPLIVRKGWLKRVLKNSRGRISEAEYVIGEGEALFKEIEKLKLEGMVCKRLDSLYASGRSKNWLKIKTSAGREEMRKRSEAWGR